MDSTAITGTVGDGPLGDLIGNYKLIRQVGEGGMGVVYHAQQLEPIRRDVALKIVKPGMDTKQVIARFGSERQALAIMDHPNIAHVFDAGATPAGRPYFVMEFVDGVPITRYCDAKRLSLKQRVELFLPVCEAIQHAHQKGIIHRDIKPSNVLVTERGGKPLVKVIDFGLAKALGAQISDASMMTNVGTVVGTLDYMSPEQADLTRQDVDTRTDVYSLGAMLYELLSGTTPLEHERLTNATYFAALERIRDEEPPPPSVRLRRTSVSAETAGLRRSDPARLPRLLRGELDWIVMKAVEKDRDHRYETVKDLLRDLQRYLDGEPVEAGPPSTAYRLRKIVRRYRIWLSIAAAFAVLLTAGVVVSTWMAVRARRAEQSAILERDTARAVSDFMQKDLLAQGSNEEQAAPGTSPDPDLKVRTAIDRAAARIDGKFASQPLVEASVRQTVGDSYDDLGLYQEAQKQFERALEIRRRVLGPNHGDTIQTMARLGPLYREQGRYAQAEQILNSVLDVQRGSLGKENPQTLNTMSELGAAFLSEGKYTLAEPLLNEALQGQRHVLGEEHRDTLKTMEHTGLLNYRQGKYQQSTQIFAKALDIARRMLGEEHPGSVSLMNDLAVVYAADGKAEQAEELYKQVLGIQSRVRGPEHPNTLTTKMNLATLYMNQGRYAQAEPLVTEVWSVAPRVWGAEHPRTLVTMSTVADVYARQGKYALAEPLYAKLADIRRRVFSTENAGTANTLASLGYTRIKLHKYDAAEPVLRESLTFFERTSPDSWLRFKSESLLGESLAGQGKYAEAEPHLVSGYTGLLQRNDAIPKNASDSVADAATWTVDLYRHWGKPDKAAEWQTKVKAAH